MVKFAVVASLGVLLSGVSGLAQGRMDESPSQASEEEEVAQGYDVAPTLVQATRPVYPPLAFERGIEMVTVLSVLVDSSGQVRRVKVTRSVPELDGAAVDCVRRWRFRPAQKAGRPVAAIAITPVAFRRSRSTDEVS